MYFNNIGKVQIGEIVGITGFIVLIAIVLFAGNYLLLKDIGKAALITNLFMIGFLYFAYIENVITRIIPMLRYWHAALICLFLLAHIWYLIRNKMPSTTAVQINQGLLVIFTGLILYNGIVNISQPINQGASEKQEADQNLLIQSDIGAESESKDLPNVYYFIFDEYAGYDSSLRYCDYNNSSFYNSLERLGFVTSPHSANGSVDTYIEIPNLLHLREINSADMADNDKKKNFNNPYLVVLMKKAGYLINLLDTTNYQFLDDSYADYKFTPKFMSTFRTFNAYIIAKTALYPFYGNNDQDLEINIINKMFAYGKESSKLEKSNLFTLGYYDFPHLPYIVDENGNKTNASDRSNLRDPVPYCKQFIYANKKILEMVTGIIENDPDSILILQSDHGFRLPTHLRYWYGIEDYDLEVEAPFEKNILNTVYYQGKDIDIENLSGLNTLKVVLNKLLETDLQIIK